jgi:hypothetical protein
LVSNTGAVNVSGNVGSLNLTNSSTVNLGATTAAGGLTVAANGGITSSAVVTANALTLGTTGGNIALGADATGTASVSLTATGAGNITSTGNVIGATIALTSGSGDFTDASGIGNLLTQTGTLTLTTTGDALISNTGALNVSGSAGNATIVNSATIDFGATSITGNLTGTASGGITSSGLIASNVLDLSTVGGDIDLGANATGTTSVTLSATGAGNITSTGTVIGSTIDLSSGSGNFSDAAGTGALLTQASTMVLNTTGDANISNTGALSVSGNLGSGDIAGSANITLGATNVTTALTVTAGGNIGTSGAVTTDTITLNSAAGGDITLSNNVTGTTTITYNAGAGGVISQAGGMTIGGALFVTSTTAVTLDTDVASLNANTTGQVTINELNALDVNNITASGLDITAGGATNLNLAITVANDISVSTTGAITSFSTLDAGGNLTLTTTAGNSAITLGGNVDAGNILAISSNGTGNITQTAGTLTAPTMQLTTGGGDIGGGVALNIDANTLALNTGAGGDALVADIGGFAFAASTVGGDLNASSTGAITNNVNVSATNLTLTTSSLSNGAAGNLNGTTNVTVNGNSLNNSGNITAGNALTVTAPTALTVSGTGTLTGTTIGLNSTTGAATSTQNNFAGLITGNSPTAFTVNSTTGSLTVGNVTAAAGVTLTTTDANSITVVGGNAVSGTALTITTGQFTVDGSATATAGTLNVASNAGGLQVNGTGTLSSTGGTILTATTGNLQIGGSLTTTGLTTMNATGGQLNVGGGSSYTSSTLTINTGDISNAGTLAASAGNLNVNHAGSALNVANNGIMSAAFAGATLQFSNNNAININGTGTLTGAAAVRFDTTANAVSVTQDNINGDVSGTANTNFAVSTNVSNLNVLDVTATLGDITFNANAGTLNVRAGADLIAGANVSATGAIDVNVGAPAGAAVTVRAGTIAGANNPLSTNLNDYDMTGITTNGAVDIVALTGDVNIEDSVSLRSIGGNVGFWSGDAINVGDNNNFFAQGGNFWMNATGIVTVGTGNSGTAVARYLPAGTVVIAGQTIRDFVGGGVAVYSGLPALSMDAELRAQAMARTVGGYETASPGVLWNPATTTHPNSGTVELIAGGAGKIDAMGATMTANGGVIRIDPPGDPIFFGGVLFAAFGPALALPPPPPPPPVDPGIPGTLIGTPLLPGFGTVTTLVSSLTAGQSARSVPVDSTKIQNTVIYTPDALNRACTPAPLATYNEAQGEGWSVSSGFCQTYAFEGKDGSTIVSAGGTAISAAPDDHTIKMKTGKMVAMSGKNGLVVETAKGKVTLPADSSAVIEENEKGVTRVAYLTGGAGTVEVGSGANKRILNADAGEELIVASIDMPDEELIPIDGVDRVTIGATIKVGSLQVKKGSYNKKMMAEREKLLNCTGGCYPVVMKNKFNKLKADLDNTGTPGAPSGPGGPGTHGAGRKISMVEPAAQVDSAYKAVAAIQRPTFVAPNVVTVDTEGTRIKHDGSAKFVMEQPTLIGLTSGELMIAAEHKTIVRCANGFVELLPNTIALVKKDKNCLKVRNIWDRSNNSIRAYAGGKMMPIGVGHEVLVSDPGQDMNKLLKTDGLSRRRITRFLLNNNQSAMNSEVSFLGLTAESPVLARVFKSEREDDKELSSKFSKMAVILNVVTGKHGNYGRINP